MVVHAEIPGLWEMEAGKSQIQLRRLVRPCPKAKVKNKKAERVAEHATLQSVNLTSKINLTFLQGESSPAFA